MLYLLESTDKKGERILKLGYTKNWETRKKAYDTHNPGYKLLGLEEGDMRVELYFHQFFIPGFSAQDGDSEWMAYDQRLVDIFPYVSIFLQEIIDMPRFKVYFDDGFFDWDYFSGEDEDKYGSCYRTFDYFITEILKWIKFNSYEEYIKFRQEENSKKEYYPGDASKERRYWKYQKRDNNTELWELEAKLFSLVQGKKRVD